MLKDWIEKPTYLMFYVEKKVPLNLARYDLSKKHKTQKSVMYGFFNEIRVRSLLIPWRSLNKNYNKLFDNQIHYKKK